MRPVFFVLFVVLLAGSCKKSDHERNPPLDCAAIECLAHFTYLQFRLVDKLTGADLVFGPAPRYDTSQVKIFVDPDKTYRLPLYVDSEHTRLVVAFARDEMYLEINGARVYKLSASFRQQSCCSDVVQALSEDGRTLCISCNETIPIPVD